MEGLIWLLFLGGFFYFMMRYGCGAHAVHGHGGHGGHAAHDDAGHGAHAVHGEHSAPSKDPVCGMEVDHATGYERTHNGQQHRFCSERCRDQFDADPARYGG